MNIVLEDDDEFTKKDLDKFGQEVENGSLELQALVVEVYYEGEEVISKMGTNERIDAAFDELRKLVVSEKITSGEYENALIAILKDNVTNSFKIISRGSDGIDEVCGYIGMRLLTVLKETRQAKKSAQSAELKMSDIVAGAIRKSRESVSSVAGAIKKAREGVSSVA